MRPGGPLSDEDTKPDGVARGDDVTSVTAPSAPGRRFGDDDIQRILQTAAELHERSHTVAHDASRGLTLDELRQVAEEAGIDPRFVDLAASTLDAPIERQESGLAGGAYRWHFRTRIGGEIRDADRDSILHAIRSVMGRKGEVADVYGRMEWSQDDGAGPTIIGISSRDGETEVDVSAEKRMEASMVHGLGIPFGGIFGGAALASLLGAANPIPAVIALSGLSYAGMRLVWRARSAWWERRLRKVIERISSIVQDVATLPPAERGDE